MLDKIRKNLTSRILKTLAQMKKKDYNEFLIFHENFSAILKEGLQSDWENKEKIADLLLFESTNKKSRRKNRFFGLSGKHDGRPGRDSLPSRAKTAAPSKTLLTSNPSRPTEKKFC